MSFKVYLNSEEEGNFLFSVTNVDDFNTRIKNSGLINSTFVIRNSKGEPCDANLNVIPSAHTSMESMVGLLQNKFSSKKSK